MSGSVIKNRDRDCLMCRLTSGTGLIGASAYVYYHSKKFNNTAGKVITNSFVAVLALLGSARLLNLSSVHYVLPPKKIN